MELANGIHNRMVDDPCHTRFYESVQNATHVSEVIFQVVQFLDLYTSLRHQLSYDNLFPVFCHLIELARPDLYNQEHIYYGTYFLKQDFLLHNLRKKNRD